MGPPVALVTLLYRRFVSSQWQIPLWVAFIHQIEHTGAAHAPKERSHSNDVVPYGVSQLFLTEGAMIWSICLTGMEQFR